MSKVRRKKPVKKVEEHVVLDDHTDASTILFGVVMVCSILIAGAALLGGSMSHVSKRWGSAIDGLASSVGLSVTKVETVGLEHDPATARNIEMAAMIEEGENMFRADPHIIRSRVEATNLVTNVRVYRLWPDTVIIRADSAQPAAVWETEGKQVVIDNLGRIMGQARAIDYPELIRVQGETVIDAVPVLAEALSLAPEFSSRAVSATRVSGRRWDVELASTKTVRLPSDEDLAATLLAFETRENTAKLAQRNVSVIDLRVPGRIYLRMAASPEIKEGA